jgi:hypothetical protein
MSPLKDCIACCVSLSPQDTEAKQPVMHIVTKDRGFSSVMVLSEGARSSGVCGIAWRRPRLSGVTWMGLELAGVEGDDPGASSSHLLPKVHRTS